MDNNLKIVLFVGDTIREYNYSDLKSESILSIDGSELGIKKEYKLLINMQHDKFYIEKNSEAAFFINDQESGNILIKDAVLVKVKLKGIDKSVYLLAYLYGSQDMAYKRYSVPAGKDVTIGRLQENDLQVYTPLVSKLHAKIRVDENGNCMIYDTSSKGGVYKNSVKIVNEAVVGYGDELFIMGLKLIYLGGVILVNGPKTQYQCRLEPSDTLPGKLPAADELPGGTFFTKAPRISRYVETGMHEIDTAPAPQIYKPQPLLLRMGPSMTMSLAMLASIGVSIQNAGSGNTAIAATSGIMAGSMLLGAIMWPTISDKYQRRVTNKEEKNRVDQYNAYLAEQEAILKNKADSIREILLNTNPEPQKVIERIKSGDRRLWERTIQDEDFLNVRIGLGDLKFNVGITVQKDKFSLTADVLKDEPKKLRDKFERIPGLPVTIPVREDGIIGIVGLQKERYNIANCLALQLAGLHGYDELKMVFLYNEAQKDQFEWVKNLPHVWSDDRSVRYVASNSDEVREIFSHISEVLSERKENRKDAGNKKPEIPYYVVFVLDKTLIDNELASNYLMDSQNGLSLSSVFIGKNISSLPSDCQTIIQYDADICAVYSKKRKEEGQLKFTPDIIRQEQIGEFSKAMAVVRLRTISENSYIPSSLDFLGMYKVGNVGQLQVLERWRDSLPHKSLAAPIGFKAGGEIFNLNIHEKYHGPHGLVAGMTGSGKSEFIQAYILSMAINFHPHDVSFILIDYKGGGMANSFIGLPHVAGIITNLGGNQIRRSLASINAELKRRQRLFEAAGVKHIDEYQKLYKEGLNSEAGESNAKIPLPHLLIISDEFAELKQQCREFMDELISAARIGRSLGVHLILATQKPSSVVDDQIWSNTRFRVCLKVFDRNDSQEMLKRPEAASIKLPGRCYVQIGYNEIFEHVQSGYSGAPYIPTDEFIDPETQKVSLIDNCARNVRSASVEKVQHEGRDTQLTAIVGHIKNLSQARNISPLFIWKEPLKDIISLDEIDGFSSRGFDGTKWNPSGDWMSPVVGVVDDPANQNQFTLRVNIGELGHAALAGMPGSGKTTFLQTLIYSLVKFYSPAEVNFYILDFGGRTMGYFNTLPHCMDVAFSDEEDKIEGILTALTGMLEERKKKFAGFNVGNIRSYIKASGTTIPAVLLFIDNYAVLKERYYDFESSIIAIAREGANFGIFLVITGSASNAISGRVMDYIKQTFTLQLMDKANYTEFVGPANGLEPEPVKGRGLAKLNVPLEFQTALAVKEADEAGRAARLNEIFQKMKAAWKEEVVKPESGTGKTHAAEDANSRNGDGSSGSRAAARKTGNDSAVKTIQTDKINQINEINIDTEAFMDKLSADFLPVAWNGKEGIVEGMDLSLSPYYSISGLDKMGKTTVLCQICRTVKRMPGWMLYIAESQNSLLKNVSEECEAEGYLDDGEKFDAFLSGFADEYIMRLNDKKEFLANGGTSEALYQYMSKYEKIFIAIDDFDSFFDMISNKALNKLLYITDPQNIYGMNIYFVTAGNPDKNAKFITMPLYLRLFQTEQGLLLGGSVNKHLVRSFENMTTAERAYSYRAGQGINYCRDRFSSVFVPAKA